jgi:hypothetical protein
MKELACVTIVASMSWRSDAICEYWRSNDALAQDQVVARATVACALQANPELLGEVERDLFAADTERDIALAVSLLPRFAGHDTAAAFVLAHQVITEQPIYGDQIRAMFPMMVELSCSRN